eukprot:scaffold3807_cov192-Pinguiococcus_pyrenoidosus.AAC.1
MNEENSDRPTSRANEKLVLDDTLTLEQLRRRTRSIITHIMGRRGRYAKYHHPALEIGEYLQGEHLMEAYIHFMDNADQRHSFGCYTFEDDQVTMDPDNVPLALPAIRRGLPDGLTFVGQPPRCNQTEELRNGIAAPSAADFDALTAPQKRSVTSAIVTGYYGLGKRVLDYLINQVAPKGLEQDAVDELRRARPHHGQTLVAYITQVRALQQRAYGEDLPLNVENERTRAGIIRVVEKLMEHWPGYAKLASTLSPTPSSTAVSGPPLRRCCGFALGL